MLPGPAVIWACVWVSLPPSVITGKDVGAWPYSVGILVKWVTFLATLHWPAAGADLGVGGVSYVEILLSYYEHWAWRKLFQGIEDQVAQFQCLLFPLFQALIFGDHVGSLGL